MKRDGEVDRSEFEVPRMDCPSEERMIRMALDGLTGVRGMTFDLSARRVTVWHAPGHAASLEERLRPLGLGAQLVGTRREDAPMAAPADGAQDHGERRTLQILLAINGLMFVAEAVAGWLFDSTGLLADSLDMLADR